MLHLNSVRDREFDIQTPDTLISLEMLTAHATWRQQRPMISLA
jgi:hypothetical protein